MDLLISQVVLWQNKRDNKKDGCSCIETRIHLLSHNATKEEILPHLTTQMKWQDLRKDKLKGFFFILKNRGGKKPKTQKSFLSELTTMSIMTVGPDQDKKLTQEAEGKPLTEFQFSRSHCFEPKLAFMRLKHINVCWLYNFVYQTHLQHH